MKKERRKEEGESSILSLMVEFASQRSLPGRSKPMKVESAMAPQIQASSMGTDTGRCTLIVITVKTTVTTKQGRSGPDWRGDTARASAWDATRALALEQFYCVCEGRNSINCDRSVGRSLHHCCVLSARSTQIFNSNSHKKIINPCPTTRHWPFQRWPSGCNF